MSTPPEVHHVQSADGTRIGFLRLGSGPPLVLVHGTTDAHEGWLPVATALADRFTCHVVDRRGRGASGDGPAYALARECEDIAAVLTFAGEGSHLLGHSFGGICSLEVARAHSVGEQLGRLVVYEPPLMLPPEQIANLAADVGEAMDRDDRDEALSRFLLGGPALSEAEVSLLKSTPIWKQMLEVAQTLPRELAAIQALPPDLRRFREVGVPTLLLVGTESKAELRDGSSALARTLPDARIHRLEGQAHVANMLAPAEVARVVAEFLAPAPAPS